MRAFCLFFLIGITAAAAAAQVPTADPGPAGPAVVAPVPEASPKPAEEKPAWRLSGDARLRYELDTSRPRGPARTRVRVRYRIQLLGDLTPELELGVRARTGPQDSPISANFSLFNSEHPETFAFNLDMGYLRYHPQGSRGFQLVAGKSPAMFGSSPGQRKLLWDTDYDPAGVWLGWEEPPVSPSGGDGRGGSPVSPPGGDGRGGSPGWYLRAGHYWLDALPRYVGYQATVAQGGTRLPVADRSHLDADLSFYRFAATDTGLLAQTLRNNHGNEVVDRNGDGRPDGFRSEFHLLAPSLTYTFPAGDLPLSLDFHYVRNLAAATSRDDGFSLGATLGKPRKAGDWSIFYHWAHLEQDAVFSPVGQTDYPLATNFEGHSLGATYQPADDWSLTGWILTARPLTPPGGTEYRYRMDLMFRY